MSHISSSSPLPQEIADLITAKARKLMGRYRFTKSDQDEIEQTISLEVVRRRAKVGEARGRHMGFLICLVEHAVADIIAARKAGCRDYRREDAPLDEWVKDYTDEWTRRGDTITEEDAGLRVGRPGMSQEDLCDLAIDISEAVARLSPRLREILEHYADLRSARKVAKAVGMHHSSVCDAMKRIKQHFETAGLEVYLSKPRRPYPTDSDTRR